MDIALVDGERRTATPGARAVCQFCGRDMVAKCGPRIIHHWAHARRNSCDPWWENETEWHRTWKGRFPEETREILHYADDGEIHIADVKTPTGIVLEFQHSSMTDAERISRERFYGNMVWIVDGMPFAENFHRMNRLPVRDNDLVRDLVWVQRSYNWHTAGDTGHFWQRSENPDIAPTGALPGQYIMYTSHHRTTEHPDFKLGFQQQFDWVRPRATWLDSTVPVYFDFGDDQLWQLQTYDDSGLRCVFPVHKRKFLHDAMTETHARDIATRWYPINPPEL